MLVNATGAWADAVARRAGVAPIGLQPLRRPAMTLPAPPGHDIAAGPRGIDVDERVYFKPDDGQAYWDKQKDRESQRKTARRSKSSNDDAA